VSNQVFWDSKFVFLNSLDCVLVKTLKF